MNDATDGRRGKIVSLPELAKIAQAARAAGSAIVQAHGVFDLLHLGHVRHLEAARREGGCLVVTVTADQFVNKGPGRPVFNELLRAEMLAALQIVDAVAVNPSATAEPALRLIRPDVYVKGAEYSNADEDVTGQISVEREVVESYGGKIIFTEDVVYSSSSLINRHLNIYHPSLQEYLDGLRSQDALGQLLRHIDGVSGLRVLVVGDTIIDEYQYVTPLERPSKETIIATQYTGREVFAGGVIAAANHIASFCRNVEVITALGERDLYEDVVRANLKRNIELTHIVRPGAPTTRKCRFVDMGVSVRKLFELYFMDDNILPPAEQARLDELIRARLGSFDLVVVADFGHGLLHGSTVELLSHESPYLAVNAQTNSANHGYNLISKYRRADYICLDRPEAQLALHDKHADSETLIERLSKLMDCDKVIITQAKNGCLTLDRSNGAIETSHVPALTSTIVDTVGAGDAFFSVTAPFVRMGVPISAAGFLGNVAGALKVGIVGHRSSVDKVPFIKFVTALLK